MTLKTLRVNEFTNLYTGWTRYGSSPYLDYVDYPNNYIETAATDDQIGKFRFEDPAESIRITINKVELHIYCIGDGDDYLEIHIFNGVAGEEKVITLLPSIVWAWQAASVDTLFFDTVTKLKNAEIYIVKKTAKKANVVQLDCAKLVYDYTPYTAPPFTVSDSLKLKAFVGDLKEQAFYPTVTIPHSTYSAWRNAEEAFQSDDVRAWAKKDDDDLVSEYLNFGLNFHSAQLLEQVLIAKEFYRTSTDEWAFLGYWDESQQDWLLYNWTGYYQPTETWYEKDITANIKDGGEANAIKLLIWKKWQFGTAPPGGCFHPDTELLVKRGNKIMSLKISKLNKKDKVLGWNGWRHPFRFYKINNISAHQGKWNMVRIYYHLPEEFVKRMFELPDLCESIGLKEVKDYICDFCVTEDHPIPTNTFMLRNEKAVRKPAGQVKKGDFLNELIWSKSLGFHTAPAKVIRTEKFTFDGNVYDLRANCKYVFGRYLLGFYLKAPID